MGDRACGFKELGLHRRDAGIGTSQQGLRLPWQSEETGRVSTTGCTPPSAASSAADTLPAKHRGRGEMLLLVLDASSTLALTVDCAGALCQQNTEEDLGTV